MRVLGIGYILGVVVALFVLTALGYQEHKRGGQWSASEAIKASLYSWIAVVAGLIIIYENAKDK